MWNVAGWQTSPLSCWTSVASRGEYYPPGLLPVGLPWELKVEMGWLLGEQRPLVGRWPKACFGEAIRAGSRPGLSSSGISARVMHTRSAVGKVTKRNPKHSHVDFFFPCLVLFCLVWQTCPAIPKPFWVSSLPHSPTPPAPSRLAEPWQGVNVVRGGCGVLRVFIKIR